MKYVESDIGIFPINKRLLGVIEKLPSDHPLAQKSIGTITATKIFDTKTLKYLPQKFLAVSKFINNIGIVEDETRKKHIAYIDKNTDDIVIHPDSFNHISTIVNGIGIASNEKAKCHFIQFKNNKVKVISEDFRRAYMPVENMAIVEFEDGSRTYAHFDQNNKITVLPQRFYAVENFQNGYGRVKDNDGWHYCCFNNNQLTVIQPALPHILPVNKEHIGVVVNNNRETNSYCKLNGNEMTVSAVSFDSCQEAKNGVAQVVYDKNKVNKIFIDKNLNIKSVKSNFPNKNYSYLYDFQPNDKQVRLVDKNGNCSFGFITPDHNFTYSAEEFQNISEVQDNVAQVDFKNGRSGFVLLGDKSILATSKKYFSTSPFHNGIGMAQDYLVERYVYVENGKFVENKKAFKKCMEFKDGFGVVITTDGVFQVLDSDFLPVIEKESLKEAIRINPEYNKYKNSSSTKATTLDDFMSKE